MPKNLGKNEEFGNCLNWLDVDQRNKDQSNLISEEICVIG